jgi:hypothetical protein
MEHHYTNSETSISPAINPVYDTATSSIPPYTNKFTTQSNVKTTFNSTNVISPPEHPNSLDIPLQNVYRASPPDYYKYNEVKIVDGPITNNKTYTMLHVGNTMLWIGGIIYLLSIILSITFYILSKNENKKKNKDNNKINLYNIIYIISIIICIILSIVIYMFIWM